jgi:hypothetical protein
MVIGREYSQKFSKIIPHIQRPSVAHHIQNTLEYEHYHQQRMHT